MNENYLLFLDFDGVICDSIDECFLSSWIAYYWYYKQKHPAAVSLDLRSQFGLLRPFVRDGEDYLLMHRILEQGGWINNQAEFDLLTAEADKELLSHFKALFYKARNYLIENDFVYWCNLNHLYPHMRILLAAAAGNNRLFILSTKKPQYIAAILEYNGIAFNKEAILYPAARSKYAVIKEVLFSRPGYQALFVDDQIDHLLKETDKAVLPYLASWGYVKTEWLTTDRVRILYPGGVQPLFDRLQDV